MKKTTIEEKIIELDFAIVKLRNDGIVQINTKDDSTITRENAEKIVEAIGKIGNNKQYLVLIIAGQYSLPESAARKYIATADANRFTICNAFVINNTAQKLMANVFLKIDRPVTPTNFFTSENEALIWLNNFHEK